MTNPSPIICIIQPNDQANTQTFIRAHIERLPTTIKVLHGRPFPSYTNENQWLIHPLFELVRRSVSLLPDFWAKIIIKIGNTSLERFLKINKVDLVLAEFGTTGVEVMEVCRKTNIPLVVHFHGKDAYGHDILKLYENQMMFDIAKDVIAVSRDMEQQLLSLGVSPDKLHYNPYGIDLDQFSGANPANNPPVFLTVGRFVDKKAPHLSILAFKQVLSHVPDAKLMMIGDGILLEACQQLVTALKIESSVEFLGSCSHEMVAKKMQHSRCFIQHSLKTNEGDSEGTPLGILEASGAGLPVVSTQHAGIKDVILHGETGFLVPENDIDGMANYMIQIATDTQLAGQLGKAGRQRIRENFSMEKSINNLWQILQQGMN